MVGKLWNSVGSSLLFTYIYSVCFRHSVPINLSLFEDCAMYIGLWDSCVLRTWFLLGCFHTGSHEHHGKLLINDQKRSWGSRACIFRYNYSKLWWGIQEWHSFLYHSAWSMSLHVAEAQCSGSQVAGESGGSSLDALWRTTKRGRCEDAICFLRAESRRVQPRGPGPEAT